MRVKQGRDGQQKSARKYTVRQICLLQFVVTVGYLVRTIYHEMCLADHSSNVAWPHDEGECCRGAAFRVDAFSYTDSSWRRVSEQVSRRCRVDEVHA
jgi:hypothetical protein